MNDKVVDNYIISLLAKPFVVLTGNSGTGKTRLALRLAERLEEKNYKVNEWVDIKLNGNGRIINKTDEEIRDLCFDSNVFVAKIQGKEFEIQIEMNIQVKCDNEEFWILLDDYSGKYIKLGIAVMIPNEERHVLIPVGADWTDAKNLLGYINPFGPGGKTVYEITPMIELILKALHPDNRYLPHFIILDEMNLSHVERYFSVFLSAMEANRSTSSKSGISLIERNELSKIRDTLGLNGDTEQKLLISAETLLANKLKFILPPNVFIIGTVNVDETTYMFSPKVLDRAHTIELETVHPSEYFQDSYFVQDYKFDSDIILDHFKKSIKYKETEYIGNDILMLLKNKWEDEEIFEGIKKDLDIVLSGIYSILKTVNFDFGYRIFKEIIEYIYFAVLYNKSNTEWIKYLDNAILQKVLPKLHGNKRQLSAVLELLIKFLNKEKVDDYIGIVKIEIEINKLDLPRSIEKLKKMSSSLDNIGYTSFIS
ncbi:hypothetical protein FB545_0715 [Peribacillus frigoritolerans]|uniref:hypothetical protein n=1 Tax=Peribacillus frigoritolerans TaxID=450367 RepID=UPI00119B5734|nr:hypothetical protein [Peribacillus frigoritolerans]TWE03639.1 hypothetical protein FB545_0715 [Peribacillus frigoritolerans]